MNTIDTKQLKALVNAGAVKIVSVHGTAGGFTITVDENLIEAKRGNARIFRKLQAAATYLKSNGIGEFTVNVAKWSPNQDTVI